MKKKSITRRRFVATGAAATAGVIAAPYVHTAHAAGSLTLGLWDHWVPGANKATEEIIKAWGEKEKVEVTVDFVTSQGSKILLMLAAESQARSGHDIVALPSWQAARHSANLEPVDDILSDLVKQNGAVNRTVEYLGKIKGKWVAVPATVGSQMKGPASRVDLMKEHAGVDILAMYPAGAPPKADAWTMDSFLKAAQACNKAGHAFGIGLGTTSDSVDTAGAIFNAFGAVLVDEKENITAKSENVRKALDYATQLAREYPADSPSWDDASNNKWLVSGRGSMIMNPPSAWAVAVRDAPKIAEHIWHHGMPSGPNGRHAPFLPYFWGIWNFGKNKSAAKSLLRHMSTEDSAQKMVAASKGYDIPAFANFSTFKTWAEIGPPKGTLYHYPNPHNHQILSIAAAPSPPRIAEQIYTQGLMTKMIVRHLRGDKMESVISYAESELEGFMRT
jgi:ABC-type glycerol-3-phosphate transport system substrate-binding protein